LTMTMKRMGISFLAGVLEGGRSAPSSSATNGRTPFRHAREILTGGGAQCTSEGIRRLPVISNTQKSSPRTGTLTL
jgi:hypothetical protein